jgi:antagonist of KipI
MENPLRVMSGSTLRLESRGDSTILYLAVEGGLKGEEVMSSRSTYTRARFGGMNGRALQKGDRLFVEERALEGEENWPEMPTIVSRSHRVVLGPHAELFPRDGLDSFFKAEYRVSLSSDRMGYRLQGPALRGFMDWGRVLTFPVFPGMVQVTPDGLPIVLMADCQTTGGYPVIAMVLAPDLCTLAQKQPGASVLFEEVTDEQAMDVVESFSYATGVGPRTKR